MKKIIILGDGNRLGKSMLSAEILKWISENNLEYDPNQKDKKLSKEELNEFRRKFLKKGKKW